MTEPNAPVPAPRQPIALLVLLLILIGGLLVVGLIAINSLAPAMIAPTATYRPTNTPDIGTDAGITPLDPPQALTDFLMIRDDGSLIRLSDLSGKYLVVYFGYTNCPDFCPLTLTEFVRAGSLLGDLTEQVNFAFISIDPLRDTPAMIRDYVQNFDESFIGISADYAVLNQISPEYGLVIDAPDGEHAPGHEMPEGAPTMAALDGGEILNHSTYSYLIDREGNLRAIISFNTQAEAIVHEIERVMAQDAG